MLCNAVESSHSLSSAARLMSLCEYLPCMTARLNGDLMCLECGRGEGGGPGKSELGEGMKTSQGENNLLYQNSFGFVMGMKQAFERGSGWPLLKGPVAFKTQTPCDAHCSPRCLCIHSTEEDFQHALHSCNPCD